MDVHVQCFNHTCTCRWPAKPALYNTYLPPTFAEIPCVTHFVANQNPDHQIQRSPELVA